MRRCGLISVYLGVSLDPFPGVYVGNLVVLSGGEGRNDVDAYHPVVRVVVSIGHDAKIQIDGAALLTDRAFAVFADKGVAKCVDHGRWRLRTVMPLPFVQYEEDVYILQRLRLGVPSVRSRQ